MFCSIKVSINVSSNRLELLVFKATRATPCCCVVDDLVKFDLVTAVHI